MIGNCLEENIIDGWGSSVAGDTIYAEESKVCDEYETDC